MSEDQMVQSWLFWLLVAGVIVIAAAALLLTIIALARGIVKLAGTALDVVGEIEQNTRAVWKLDSTNRTAGEIATGAEAIADNAAAVAAALTGRLPGTDENGR